MTRSGLIALLGLAAPAAAHAQATATAQAAFQHAQELEKQGKWAEACPLYDASYRDDPHLGTLLYLAACHEHIGLLATAAAEFTDAVELAHRTSDAREAAAQRHVDALKPRLAHLNLAPPATPIPGLVVKRDGVDMTVLVGTDMPIDPGDHELVATAPGRIEWRKKLTIGALPTTVPLDIPPLELAPVTPDKPVDGVRPAPRDGTLHLTSQSDAHLLVDGRDLGVGRAEATLHPGGHLLRVTAPGMRPYQAEITIGDAEERALDIPLDREVTAIVVAPPPEDGPGFELGASVAPGVKLHGDRPVEIAYRFELALRRGRRVNVGLFLELGSIDAASGRGACGTDLPGAKPATPFDFGSRDQFTQCRYELAGLQLYVHILPRSRVDPYLGIAPGFRLTNLAWTPFDATGVMQTPQRDTWPGLVADVRAGVDYHPTPSFRGWQVGVVLSAELTVFGEESPHGNGVTYFSLFGGLRSTIQF